MINVSLGLVADYANVSREGKLNIMGTFDEIWSAQVPTVHPAMVLVLVLEAESGDADKSHKLGIELVDADGGKVFSIDGELRFNKPAPGRKIKTNQLININNIQLPKFGSYAFNIFINNEVRSNIPISVAELKQKAN